MMPDLKANKILEIGTYLYPSGMANTAIFERFTKLPAVFPRKIFSLIELILPLQLLNLFPIHNR